MEEFFEFDDVFREIADPFGELLGRHRILIQMVAEGFLVDVDLLNRGVLCFFGLELAGNGGFSLFELLEKRGSSSLTWVTLYSGELPEKYAKRGRCANGAVASFACARRPFLLLSCSST